MPRLSRVLAAAGRAAAWLLPARQREWVAAVWAEAHAVPPGLTRLAWRAGGSWMVAREALRPRRLAKVALFAAAAAAAAWAAWPDPTMGHAAVSRFGVIVTVALLAGLPLLARRFLGPASPSRAGRALRVFCWTAILALIPARIITEVFADFGPRPTAYLRVNNIFGGMRGVSSGGAPWPGEIVILLIIAGYGAAFLFLTSRRSGAGRSTLAIGAGTGLLFGVVMYAVAPLGLGADATNPWLPGSDADPLVALAWLLLVGGPAAAAILAVRRGRGADGSALPAGTSIGQGIAAGVLANLTGALFVTAAGTGTTALMLGSASVRQWVYHGQQLSALALYHREQTASVSTEVYVLMCVVFPVIGLIVSAVAAAVASPVPRELGPAAAAPVGPGLSTYIDGRLLPM
jgi:hypothetical protein